MNVSEFPAYEPRDDRVSILRNGRGYLDDLAYVLDSGIKVALIYGGEEVSRGVNYADAAAFRAAGYTPLHTNPLYVGGQLRQHGNFSFPRVYEAGHEVPAYQPETAYEIFQRSVQSGFSNG